MKKNPEETIPFDQTEEAAVMTKINEDLDFLEAELAKAEAGRQKLLWISELMQTMYKNDMQKMAELNLSTMDWFTMPRPKEELTKSDAPRPAYHFPPEPPIPAKKPIANRIKQYIINIYKGLQHRISKGMDKHE